MCRVLSCVVGRGCLLWPVCSPAKLYSPLPCFILYSKAKFACYSRCFLTSYFCIPVPYNEKDIGPCFHHQSHPQLGHVFALSPSVHSFWSYFSSSILGIYWPGEFIFQSPIFLPFHIVHAVLKSRMLKWFAIPFSSGPHFVRSLHDPAILGDPYRAWLIVSLSYTRLWFIWSIWLVFCDCDFHSLCPLMDEDKRPV